MDCDTATPFFSLMRPPASAGVRRGGSCRARRAEARNNFTGRSSLVSRRPQARKGSYDNPAATMQFAMHFRGVSGSWEFVVRDCGAKRARAGVEWGASCAPAGRPPRERGTMSRMPDMHEREGAAFATSDSRASAARGSARTGVESGAPAHSRRREPGCICFGAANQRNEANRSQRNFSKSAPHCAETRFLHGQRVSGVTKRSQRARAPGGQPVGGAARGNFGCAFSKWAASPCSSHRTRSWGLSPPGKPCAVVQTVAQRGYGNLLGCESFAAFSKRN